MLQRARTGTSATCPSPPATRAPVARPRGGVQGTQVPPGCCASQHSGQTPKRLDVPLATGGSGARAGSAAAWARAFSTAVAVAAGVRGVGGGVARAWCHVGSRGRGRRRRGRRARARGWAGSSWGLARARAGLWSIEGLAGLALPLPAFSDPKTPDHPSTDPPSQRPYPLTLSVTFKVDSCSVPLALARSPCSFYQLVCRERQAPPARPSAPCPCLAPLPCASAP